MTGTFVRLYVCECPATQMTSSTYRHRELITACNNHMGAVGGNGITSLAPVTRESVGLSVFVCVGMRFCAFVRACKKRVSDPVITQWCVHLSASLWPSVSLSPINSHCRGDRGIQLEPPCH